MHIIKKFLMAFFFFAAKAVVFIDATPVCKEEKRH
jgi:hypothetical protein